MKNHIFKMSTIAVIILFSLQSFKNVRPENYTETVVIQGKDYDVTGIIKVPQKAYILAAPGPGNTMPVKRCRGIGYDCNNTAQAIITQYEWDTFFPEINGPSKFDLIDIHDYPEYVAYLQGIGFGM